MSELRTVWVTTSFVGFHFWPDAPLARGYLRAPHRHRFGVRVEVPVDHDDREMEFHDLLDAVHFQVQQLAPVNELTGVSHCGGYSCEMMAERIAQNLRENFDRPVTVTVDEDGECGATVALR